MNNVPPFRQLSEPQHVTDQRHAEALSSIQKMRNDYANMHQSLADAERENARLKDLIAVLQEDKTHYRENAEVYQRKLIRLANSMSMLGKLSEEAMAIMKDASDFEEAVARSEKENMQTGQSAADLVGELRAMKLTGGNG